MITLEDFTKIQKINSFHFFIRDKNCFGLYNKGNNWSEKYKDYVVVNVYSDGGVVVEIENQKTNEKKTFEKLSIEEKIEAIIQKVRGMYKYTKKLAEPLSQTAYVQIKETSDHTGITFTSIKFPDYNSIYVSEKAIIFEPEYGNPETLIEYNSWEELLNM